MYSSAITSRTSCSSINKCATKSCTACQLFAMLSFCVVGSGLNTSRERICTIWYSRDASVACVATAALPFNTSVVRSRSGLNISAILRDALSSSPLLAGSVSSVTCQSLASSCYIRTRQSLIYSIIAGIVDFHACRCSSNPFASAQPVGTISIAGSIGFLIASPQRASGCTINIAATKSRSGAIVKKFAIGTLGRIIVPVSIVRARWRSVYARSGTGDKFTSGLPDRAAILICRVGFPRAGSDWAAEFTSQELARLASNSSAY